MTYFPNASSPQNADLLIPTTPTKQKTDPRGLNAPRFVLCHKPTNHFETTVDGVFHSIDAALQFVPLWLAETIKGTDQTHNDPATSCQFVVNEVGANEDKVVATIPARTFLPVSLGIMEVSHAITLYQAARDRGIALRMSLTGRNCSKLSSQAEGQLATSAEGERKALRALNTAFFETMKLGVASWNKPNAGAAEFASFLAAYNLPETFASRYRVVGRNKGIKR